MNCLCLFNFLLFFFGGGASNKVSKRHFVQNKLKYNQKLKLHIKNFKWVAKFCWYHIDHGDIMAVIILKSW